MLQTKHCIIIPQTLLEPVLFKVKNYNTPPLNKIALIRITRNLATLKGVDAQEVYQILERQGRVLIMPVDDVETPGKGVMFTKEDAEKVIDFANKQVKDGVAYFIVHCEMGMSRSPAIAAFIAGYIFNDKEEMKQILRARPFANRQILSTLIEVYNNKTSTTEEIEEGDGSTDADSKMSVEERIIEKLAELEHEQWVTWSKEIARTEKLSEERIKRWQTFWNTPYEDLPEEIKEEDRKWARKVLDVLKKFVRKK